MKLKSESQCLVQLQLIGEKNLNADEIYRALVFSANSGILEPQVEYLDTTKRLLLESRVMMSKGLLHEAFDLLLKLNQQEVLAQDLAADTSFLLGINAFRRGDKNQYLKNMAQAKQKYLAAGDDYRALRAAINLNIIDSGLTSFECGNLKAFSQETIRNQYFDLAGNIYKAEAIERFKKLDIEGALVAVSQALRYYEIDACPEDLSLTQVLSAILHKLNNDDEKAKFWAQSAKIKHGKVKEYWDIWLSLRSEKLPVTNKSHQLSAIPWKQFLKKSASITQKIVSELKLKALSKNDVIKAVWGENCLDPSYESRFFSAMRQLKKQNYIISFDGEKYRIV